MGGYPQVIEARIGQIKLVKPLTTDSGVIAPNTLMVEALIGRLRVTLDAICRFDERIAKVARAHDDFALFQALVPFSPHACSPPSVSNGSAIQNQMTFSNTQALPQSPTAAAVKPGRIGD